MLDESCTAYVEKQAKELSGGIPWKLDKMQVCKPTGEMIYSFVMDFGNGVKAHSQAGAVVTLGLKPYGFRIEGEDKAMIKLIRQLMIQSSIDREVQNNIDQEE